MSDVAPDSSLADLRQVQDFLNELRYADWGAAVGPMRLSCKLELQDFAEAKLPANVRLLMTALEAEGGTAATATGNLNRHSLGSYSINWSCWMSHVNHCGVSAR